MKNKVLLVLLVIVFSVVAADAQKKTSQPKTAVDYYLILPQKFLGDGYEADVNRRDYLKNENGNVIVRDDKNGYLSVNGDGARPGVTLALFKKTGGKYLIGVTLDWENGNDFYMLDYAGGKWKNVTKTVVPNHETCENEEEGECTMYELPRYGTTVIARNNNNEKIYELVWQKNKFVVQK